MVEGQDSGKKSKVVYYVFIGGSGRFETAPAIVPTLKDGRTNHPSLKKGWEDGLYHYGHIPKGMSSEQIPSVIAGIILEHLQGGCCCKAEATFNGDFMPHLGGGHALFVEVEILE